MGPQLTASGHMKSHVHVARACMHALAHVRSSHLMWPHADILVVAVGEQPATFGTPGVKENCFFMKEVRSQFVSWLVGWVGGFQAAS